MAGSVDLEEGGGQSRRASTRVLSEIWRWEEGTWGGLKHKSDLIFLKDRRLLSREMNTVSPLNPWIQPTSDGKYWGQGEGLNLRKFPKAKFKFAALSSTLNPCKLCVGTPCKDTTYIRGVSILQCGYLVELGAPSWNQSPEETEGRLYRGTAVGTGRPVS